MKKHYLLDTNIISYLTDPNSPHRESIKTHLLALDEEDNLSVSIITLYELTYGLHSFHKNDESKAIFKKGITFIEEYLDVIPLDVAEVEIFGQLKAKYKEATGTIRAK